jgi:hypothetical protein
MGKPDSQGMNSGNWTVEIGPKETHTQMPFYEVYKAVFRGAVGSTLTWYVEQMQWETRTAANDVWDPNQALLLRQGETMYFYWNTPHTQGPAPSVTVWMRYDPAIDANQRAVSGLST